MNRIESPSYVIRMTERVIYECGTYETMQGAQKDLIKLKRNNFNPCKTYTIEEEWDDYADD